MDNRQNEKKNTILTDIQAEKPLINVYESVKSLTPSEISRQYITTVKDTENRLIGTAGRYNRQLEKVNKSRPHTDAGILIKHKKTQYLKKRVDKAERKRDVYVSKNYRKQTIKRDIYQSVSHKLTEKTKSSLLGIEYRSSGNSKNTSNLLCLDIKKDGGQSLIRLISPSVKKAQIKIKKLNKTLRNSGNLIRNMKIQAVLDSENPAMEVAKRGVVAAASAVTRLAELIIKSSLKLVIKLLMPIVPYILLCLAPFILLIIYAASGSNDINSSVSVSSGTAVNKVMERAKTFVGEDGSRIWEYYGMKNHWCCMFIWTCFNIEGVGDLFYDGGKTAYVPDLDTWALSHPEQIIYYKNNITGQIIGDPEGGKYGDIVLYDYAPYDNYSDHVAFIESYNEDGSYTTIEGNTGGTGSGYDFYTSSSVHMYTSYLWSKSYMLHMIIRPQYNSISK